MEAPLTDGLPMRVYLAAEADHLYAAAVHDDVHPRSEDEFFWSLRTNARWERVAPSHPSVAHAAGQVSEYLAAQRREFQLAVSFRGTPFLQRIWRYMMEIPFGETSSYGELAEMAGHPGASRAVGSANRRNQFGLIVPCHRVLAAGGKLGGYAGGLGLKRRLLAHEAAVCRASA